MIVECPSCQTKYSLPDDRIGPDGANVRCSVCKHVFHVDAPEEDDFPGFGDSGATPSWPVDGLDEELAQDKETAGRKKDPFDDASLSSADFTSIDFGKTEKSSQ